MIMIGGQILIIFVGGQAFEITPLNGKEWGLSVGLGAISIPWGALIRLTPDSWIEACIPQFIKKWLEPKEPITDKDIEDGEVRPPLRVMSSIRGPRVQQHIGFKAKMHKKLEKTKEKMTGSSSNVAQPV